MNERTRTPCLDIEPADWEEDSIEVGFLELEWCIDEPWMSGRQKIRDSQAQITHVAREHLRSGWMQAHGLKPCKPFALAALAARCWSKRKETGWEPWPPGGCFDHLQFYVDAATGQPACVLLEPYHHDPETYEPARPELEAIGLTFALHAHYPPSFYDPLRASVMVVVRETDARFQHLGPEDLKYALGMQAQYAAALMTLMALEHTHQNSSLSGQAFLEYALPEWKTFHLTIPSRLTQGAN